MIVTDKAILHALRTKKEELGKSLSIEELEECIEKYNYSSIYYDETHKNYQFITMLNGKTLKLVFGYRKEKINGTKTKGIFFITAGVIDSRNTMAMKKIK